MGKISEYDRKENDYHITFMEKKVGGFHWPRKEDELWVAEDDVIQKVATPVPVGRGKRQFKLSSEDMEILFD